MSCKFTPLRLNFLLGLKTKSLFWTNSVLGLNLDYFDLSGKKKLAKRSFRARPRTNFKGASKTSVSCEASSKQQAFKTSVSCKASDNFHRRSSQNERFVRGFRQFSQKKLPNDRFVRGFLQISQNNASKTPSLTRPGQCADEFQALKICISKHSFVQSSHRILREQQNQNVRLATAACHPKFRNVRFATAACTKMYESSARRPRQPAPYQNHHFTTVSDVGPARSDERVARASSKFAFHNSFGRPMSTKRRKGCSTTQRLLPGPPGNQKILVQPVLGFCTF